MFLRLAKQSQFIPLQNVVYFITLPFATSCNTQSSVPEDGQNNCPKHVELIGIIKKPLFFNLICFLYYLYFIIFFETC